MPALNENMARPSRAAEVAAVHLGSINESRKKCGLVPLSLAELAREFEDVDRTAPNKMASRANEAARRFEPPRSTFQSQAEIDAMHADIVDKLNATLPAQWRPKGRR